MGKRCFMPLAALLTLSLISCTTPAVPEPDLPPEQEAPGPVPELPEDPEPALPPELPEEPEPDPEPETPEKPELSPPPDAPADLPPYTGPLTPEGLAAHAEAALRAAVPLTARFPRSELYVLCPAIPAGAGTWTVYTTRVPETVAEDGTVAGLPFDAQTLPLPEEDWDTARPLCALPGAGSGELELIVELQTPTGPSYVTYDNYDWTGETDATLFTYRGPLSPERVAELEGFLPHP